MKILVQKNLRCGFVIGKNKNGCGISAEDFIQRMNK